MKLTAFDIEFFEIALQLKNQMSQPIIDSIKKTLLKLNNPTYYSKHTCKHPANKHGYYNNKTINQMLNIIKEDSSLEHKKTKLQVSYSWAFNNYPYFSSLV
jgi:hypothetical protein